jgi:hypothetical protein
MGAFSTSSSGLADFSLSIRSAAEAPSSPKFFMIGIYDISATAIRSGFSMTGVPDMDIARLNSGSLECN